jgi:hypothetical protein
MHCKFEMKKKDMKTFCFFDMIRSNYLNESSFISFYLYVLKSWIKYKDYIIIFLFLAKIARKKKKTCKKKMKGKNLTIH